MSTPPEHEVVIVGGGPAGLTAAVYTTRLSYDTAVINRGGGRASLMWNTHNAIGITEDTLGNEFLEIAATQLEEYGAKQYTDRVKTITRADEDDRAFRVEANHRTVLTDRVMLVTGFNDKPSNVPMAQPSLAPEEAKEPAQRVGGGHRRRIVGMPGEE